ncbi:hypothetical protein FC96_GL001914 [Secundilactobacillus kimchicus JCM 15530]|uniref:Terminase large subunit gp17-like C-terminal domain-containing protein n=1 Tax=Secundilactobacillus kimchicus JCM 15530 TaxID=1302272 RepID=A0A0R1HX85_9LACO|nr:PBSX family phage terminase large subunit [Secundilactobacillus kimchicus]KRK48177.1 hypothetical protein FC96_GL001914 [Secundilactobacillus kimchicus JCM 15530]
MKTPQFNYAPFSPKQLEVLSWWLDPRLFQAKVFENAWLTHPQWRNREEYEAIICDGSIRAGKTMTMSMSYIEWSMTNYDGQQFGIAGKTIGSLRRNVIRPLKTMLEGRGFKVIDRRADNMLEIKRGSKTNFYFLFGGKDESSQDLVQGITLAGFFFDEVALMPESFVNQATGRVSVDGGKLWFNCNPAGPYHWFKLEWLDQLEKHKALHIHFMMDDNPALAESVKDRFKRSYSGVFYMRYIEGLWVLSDGIIYDNFDEQKMVVDAPDYSNITQYYVSCDYGAQNPTVFLLWGFSDGVWYLLREYYYDARHDVSGVQKTDQQYADDLGNFLGPIIAPIIVDPAAQNFIIELESRGYQVYQAYNNVLDGIRLTQSLMSNGQIKFTRNLPNLFKEFASYVWDDKAAQRGEDKPTKDHDHTMDAMRYFCATILQPETDNGNGIQLIDHY